MHRRQFLSEGITAASIGLFSPAVLTTAMVAATTAGALPQHRTIRVAFLLGDNANVIDTADTVGSIPGRGRLGRLRHTRVRALHRRAGA